MKVITKNNHFIPQFILKNFVDSENKIYHFSKTKKDWSKKEKTHPIGASTKKTAQHYHLYTTEDNDLPTDKFEKRLAKIEAGVAPIIKKLLISESKVKRLDDVLSPNELGFLIFFLTISLRRTPTYLKYINKHFVSAIDTVDISDDFFKEEDREYIKREKNKALIHNNFTVPFIFNEDQVEELFLSLFEYKWFILSAESFPYDFLLGDTLVSFMKLPVNQEENEVYVPIGNKHLLCGIKCEGNVCETRLNLNLDIIKKINEFIIGNADEYIFCTRSSEGLRKFIKRTLDRGSYCDWNCLFPLHVNIDNTYKMKDLKE